MAGFKQLSGLVVPLDVANVDTDAIIPKQFLQAITRVGFGKHLFHEWRYLDVDGTQQNPGIRAELSAISRCNDFVGAQKFGLWIIARTCAVGIGGLRLQSNDCTKFCRYFLQQQSE